MASLDVFRIETNSPIHMGMTRATKVKVYYEASNIESGKTKMHFQYDPYEDENAVEVERATPHKILDSTSSTLTLDVTFKKVITSFKLKIYASIDLSKQDDFIQIKK